MARRYRVYLTAPKAVLLAASMVFVRSFSTSSSGALRAAATRPSSVAEPRTAGAPASLSFQARSASPAALLADRLDQSRLLAWDGQPNARMPLPVCRTT